jgi:peroxiredoxin
VAAEARWLETWKAGPGEERSHPLEVGGPAPDITLPDQTGTPVALSSFWLDGAALVMFWRHFGCSCGRDRNARLIDEVDDYLEAGISPVIVGQGEPERAAAYKEKYRVPCPILCDPETTAYRAYGLGDFRLEQVLYDAPEVAWSHSETYGADLQETRRDLGRPMVDSAWMSPGEFLVDSEGKIRVSYAYQYCEDFPDPRVFTTAARLRP